MLFRFLRLSAWALGCWAWAAGFVPGARGAASHGVVYRHEWGRVLSLDGTWQIGEGGNAQPPSAYAATIPVPGLVTSARPAFADVGIASPRRAAFWYRTTFKVPGKVPPLARLKIGKAMYGTTVFLNGHAVGASDLCFVPLYFTVTPFLKGDGQENELLIRVGAHISNLPDTVVSGGDAERQRYIPGVYDRVELLLSDAAYIAHVQVAPQVESQRIDVAVDFADAADADAASARALDVEAAVYEAETGKCVARGAIRSGAIRAGATKRVMATFAIPGAKLWTPDTPNLYVLELKRGDDTYQTRFGMRSFKVDPAYTSRALLNGQPCYIRGTNFGIHRFFEDPECRQHPWDPHWVRTMIRKFTAAGMNGVRFTIGPAPELWYDIADEEGFMIFDEYAIWYAFQPDVGDVSRQRADPHKRWGIWPAHLTTAELVKEYTAWMQERWNHPSVICWDAQNETWAKQTGEAIEAVRKLDLSHRPWDNGWSPPQSPNDLREAHEYFESWTAGTEMSNDRKIGPQPFGLDQLATAVRVPSTFYLPGEYTYHDKVSWYWQQPCVLNEYSYLWLFRDGSPTTLTKPYYDVVLGPNQTEAQRRELYARYLAAVTEYWRATRSCFAVLYPFGLAGSIPGGATSDNWTDVAKLQWDPYFTKYVPDAFAPVGVCAELWQNEYKVKAWHGTAAEFPVTVINDTSAALDERFDVIVRQGERVVSTDSFKFDCAPFGLSRTFVKIDLPKEPGRYEVVTSVPGRDGKPVSSYRPITMLPEGK